MGDQADPICYRFARAVGRFFKKRTPIDYFTFALAGSTLAQVYFFVQSERAFLAISGMTVSGLTTMLDKPLEFSYEIKNGGRSTAFIEYTIANVTITPDELPDFPHYIYGGRSLVRGPIVAGGTYNGAFTPKNGDGTLSVATDSQISAINIGTSKLYIFGYIQYRDEFSLFGYKEIGYCYVFNPRGDPTKFMFLECGKEHYVYAK